MKKSPRSYRSPVKLSRKQDTTYYTLETFGIANFAQTGPKRISRIFTILGSTMATSIYGENDALAWSAHFDSTTEILIWRISSCVVMGGLPVTSCLAGWEHKTLHKDHVICAKFWPAFRRIKILIFVAYTHALAYLVVGCLSTSFISRLASSIPQMFYLPPSNILEKNIDWVGRCL